MTNAGNDVFKMRECSRNQHPRLISTTPSEVPYSTDSIGWLSETRFMSRRDFEMHIRMTFN